MDVQQPGPSSSFHYPVPVHHYPPLDFSQQDPSTTSAPGRSQANNPMQPPLQSPAGNASHLPFASAAAAATTIGPPTTSSAADQHDVTGMRKMRKRKADTQDNERLSKRLSLLNLEKNGQKLYVPVESPQLPPTTDTSSLRQMPESDQMQLDESSSSKHKVYIYDLDAELSSDGEESSSDEGKLIFLPDIAKHLRQQSRIPPRVLANDEGELAGMQMVLYSDPKSLTVPESQDSVRKAIIDVRARLRQRQNGQGSDLANTFASPSSSTIGNMYDTERRIPNGLNDLANAAAQLSAAAAMQNTQPPSTSNYDPDAMEMDID